MSYYSAYIEYIYICNNKKDSTNCTISDKKYDVECVSFQHGNTTYYIRSSEFDNKKVKITYWEF